MDDSRLTLATIYAFHFKYKKYRKRPSIFVWVLPRIKRRALTLRVLVFKNKAAPLKNNFMSEIVRNQQDPFLTPPLQAESAGRRSNPFELQAARARHSERDARREMMQAETKARKFAYSCKGIAQRPGPIQYSKSVAESFSIHSSQLLNSA